MERLNQDELLEELRQIKIYVQAWKMLNPKKVSWTSKREQAYQQIKEMIQKPEGLPQKRGLTIDEIISKYPESIKILLVELLLKIENLKKPEIIIRPRFSKRTEVTEEFIGNKGRELFGWSADPRTIKECEDFIRSLVGEVRK